MNGKKNDVKDINQAAKATELDPPGTAGNH